MTLFNQAQFENEINKLALKYHDNEMDICEIIDDLDNHLWIKSKNMVVLGNVLEFVENQDAYKDFDVELDLFDSALEIVQIMAIYGMAQEIELYMDDM